MKSRPHERERERERKYGTRKGKKKDIITPVNLGFLVLENSSMHVYQYLAQERMFQQILNTLNLVTSGS